MSADLVKPVFEATESVPIWWISDVYITGFIPRYLQTHHQQIQHLVFTDYLEDPSYFFEKLKMYPKTTIFGVVKSKSDLYSAWNILKNAKKRTSFRKTS